jgi:hypothetical protein
MLSQDDKKMTNRDYWVNFSDNSAKFLTAKQITAYILVIALCVQIIGLLITPTDLLIWNALTFIIATNLGAVILAIHAQKSADEIRDMYRVAFNADFYHTLHILTTLKIAIEREADREGISLQQEVDNLGMDSYSVIRGYMKSFSEHYHLSQQQEETPEDVEMPNYENESELFQE